jgi:hypothetical protein
MVCLADDEDFDSDETFDKVKSLVIDAFETVFPEKSSFEK